MSQLLSPKWTAAGLLVLLLGAGGGNSIAANDTDATLSVNIDLGPNSTDKDWYQMAIWLEDTEGHYVDTLYVTDAVGREGLGNSYIKIFGFTIRAVPGSLPVWAHARNVRYGKSFYPPKTDPLPDGMTGATVKTDHFVKSFHVPLDLADHVEEGEMVCRMELNVSRDDLPSMVFEARLDNAKQEWGPFKFIGYGDEDGSSGAISRRPDLDGNVKDYLKRAYVHLETPTQSLAKK